MAEPSAASKGQPTVLGRYELLAHLASGGMAEVWLARLAGAKGFGRFFALKRMHRTLASQDKFVRMFLDEAEVASHVQHPNVVPIFELGEEEGELFLVMELVIGASLSTLLARSADRGERLPLPAVAQILGDTALGLHAAHTATAPDGSALGIVHRDVSPQNVLVGVDGRARVVDFGIAKALMRSTETQTGELKGKLSYYSPEQALARQVDARSDVFALGIVLWECLVGQRLFRSDSPLETLRRITQDRIVDPRDHAPVPTTIAKVAMHALERDPARRIPSAAAFEAELRAAALAAGVVPGAEAVTATVEREAADKVRALRSLVSRRWTQRQALVAAQGLAVEESGSDGASGVRVSDTIVTPPSLSLAQTGALVDPRAKGPGAPIVVAVAVGLVAAVGGGLLAWVVTGGSSGGVDRPAASTSPAPPAPPVAEAPAVPAGAPPAAAAALPTGLDVPPTGTPPASAAGTPARSAVAAPRAEPARGSRTGRTSRAVVAPLPPPLRPPPLLGPSPTPVRVTPPAPRVERPAAPEPRATPRPTPAGPTSPPSRGVIRDYDP